jgi:CheY-like chemotaxis protein
MNLAVNARDAMPGGGKLTIETHDTELDENYARSHADARVGPHVLLAVTDTGTGMPAEVQARIFEPFFTTKEMGRGTGLGLSTVYGIVKQSGGNIWVYSEPGRGTTFKVYLPRAVITGEVAPEAAPRAAAPRGQGTILIVEDEEAVRALAQDVLQSSGYTVLTAPDGPAAIKAAAAHAGAIDLMLTDVVLPGMGGPQIAREITGTRPALKVLFMSGYTDNAIVHHGVLDPGTAFLEKPIRPAQLLQKVRDVLG